MNEEPISRQTGLTVPKNVIAGANKDWLQAPGTQIDFQERAARLMESDMFKPGKPFAD